MKSVVLQIYLKTGSAFNVILREPLAEQIFEQWRTNYYAVKGLRAVEGRTVDDVDFCVLVDQIGGILKLPYNLAKQQSQQQPQRPWGPGASGNN